MEDKTIHQLFGEKVAKTPNNIAIVFEDKQLTYQELNDKANQLAHCLREKGVGPDILVALLCERSLEMMIGILGILKAGGAYVPIDPNVPVERLAYLLEDTKASLVLTQSQFSKILSKTQVEILYLDEAKIFKGFKISNPDLITKPNHLAYVIYTSGSTGNPKGVLIPHKNVIRLFTATDAWYQFNEHDVWTLFHSYAFDFSVWEMWGALFYGGKLVIIPYLTSRDINEFYQLLMKEKVTVLNQTPSAFQLLISHDSECDQRLSSLRYIIFGGEALTLSTLLPWFEKYRDQLPTLINMYGITETTVHVSYIVITHEMTKHSKASLIGKPISDLKLYILDTHKKITPIKNIGEIYVGGEGLARGYLNRPELTAERFIDNPFVSEEDKQRSKNLKLYKTGDLARYLEDGNIEYIGRIDTQVKIRGFRIELGEIEAILLQHPNVKEAVVIAREDTPGDKRLVAYLVMKNITESEQLKSYLLDKLPNYMIPSAFVTLSSMPLTCNEKLDRCALPAPDYQSIQNFVAPRNAIEVLLCEVWKSILKIKRIGVHDNFFDLGGHSLLATQIVSRLRMQHRVIISLKEFFQAPTIAKLAELVSNTDKIKENPIEIVTRKQNKFRLSFAQQRMWFIDQLTPNNPFCNIPIAIKLRGTLNSKALQHAVNMLAKRHEILRTVFKVEKDLPYQFIKCKDSINVNVIKITSEESIKKFINKEIIKSFSLEQGPLIRITLIKKKSNESILILTIHHIIGDGWSMGLIGHELSESYNALLEKRKPLLPFLPIQYADFSIWQRDYLKETGDVYQKQLCYWTKTLKGAPILLELPTDYTRPAVQNFKGDQERFILSSSLVKKLKKVSRENQATLYMTLLTAFYILLYRYSNQEDIALGTSIANRNRYELEYLIGFFVNTLALRAKISPSFSFKELLAHVRHTTLEAYDAQDLPLEAIIEHLKIERSLSYHTLFQVFFVLQNAGEDVELKLKNIETEKVLFDFPIARFDLLVNLIETPEESIKGFFEYARDLYQASTIQRMITHYQTLLEDIVEYPQNKISQFQITTEVERQQLLNWNTTEKDYPKDKTVHQLFEEQVAKTPNNIAVVFEDKQLSYQELNAKANQLAHCLREKGVGPDVLVGILYERSLEMIVGILGILKAGGAYVPICPKYPKDRLTYVLQDANIAILLTQTTFLKQVPEINAEIICLEKSFEGYSKENYPYFNLSGSLAYVIYTSGSTGKPKGVMIEHRSLTNFIYAIQERCLITVNDKLLSVTTISFDIAGLELYLPLVHGAQIILANQDTVSNGQALVQLLESTQASLLQATPSTWNMLLDAGWKGSQEFKILCGGEALTDNLARMLRSKAKTLLNLYGPTETTIWSTVSDINTNKITIGTPIANTKIYILDNERHPVPIGVVGELYIGGDGLARGYLNRLELTQERFIKNPFASDARLYKTGDLCRWLSNGNIEYIGRIDTQVKIRGFRIELGEIEAILLQHPNVREAVVIAREDIPGDKRLVAYFTCQEGKNDIQDLSHHLRKTLPDYMIPNYFVHLEAFPLTPNGKIDCKSLPKPTYHRDKKGFISPTTEAEIMLAKVWCDILRIDKISVNDNFFELGGHSLLATQVVSRLRREYQIELSLRALFKMPVLAELAQMISSETRKEQASIPVVKRMGELPLSFAQARMWFIDQLIPDGVLYNIPLVLSLKGKLEIEILQDAFNKLVERHEVLRTVFKVSSEKPYQCINVTGGGAIQRIDLSKAPPNPNPSLPYKKHMGEKGTSWQRDIESHQCVIKSRIEEEILQPFYLDKGPLIRVSLIKIYDDEYVLLVVLHHSIADGWSIRVIEKELSEFYNALVEMREARLPVLPIQYVDFSVWQREYLKETSEVYQKQLQYWIEILKGAPKLLELPTDYPRPATQSYKGKQYYFDIPVLLYKKLKRVSREQNATLFMTLLTAFYIFLYRYTNQKDIVVGSPIANRNRQELEHLIGFFVNILALRATCSGDMSFKELLSQVQQITLGAYEHQDLPFEKLIDHLKVERSLAYEPLFQVMFNLQVLHEGTQFKLEGIESEYLAYDYPISKFDLTLSIEERDESLKACFEYSTDLFQASTIERMSHHFENILHEIIKTPEVAMNQLKIVTSEEEQRMLVDWNTTERDYPKDKTIHQMFEEQVAKTPNNIAIVFEDKQLTYQELNDKANQLAHCLREKGMGPDILVALLCERYLEMMIGILGILKAGGAYVPIDPNIPAERLAYLLEDTKVPLLLTQRAFAKRLPKTQAEILYLDEAKIFKGFKISNLTPITKSNHLAYVIYTSGSTGNPKGVLIPHKNVIRLFSATDAWYQFNEQDVWTLFHSYAFDVSVWEIWGALFYGGKLVIVPYLTSRDTNEFYQLLIQEKVTVLNQTPSAFQLLISHDKEYDHRLSNLRYIIFAGEALTLSTLLPWFEKYGDQLPTLINMYGITETTVHVSYIVITHKMAKHSKASLIGKPIPDLKLYILDTHKKITPIKNIGEIYVGGEGLARGYLNRPELTAERFIDNPFVSEEDKQQGKNLKLYKTGDLARYLEDGNIEYIGRIDTQVKIRGFRIELGEIEATLLQYPNVKEAVVIAREDIPGDKRLVAYYTCQQGQNDIQDLNHHLRTTLPDYMIPSYFVRLEALPLTLNGKLDRRALPAPVYHRDKKVFIAPTTEIEMMLAKVWGDILRIDTISVNDNFFALGGNSLQIVALVSKIRKNFSHSVSVKDFYAFPTIAEQANYLGLNKELQTEELSSHVINLNVKGNPFSLFLIHPGLGLGICYKALLPELKHIDLYTIQHPHFVNPKHEFNTLKEMAAYYIKIIKTIQPKGPYRLGGWSFGGLVAYEMARQLSLREKVDIVLMIDTFHPKGNIVCESAYSKEEKETLMQAYLHHLGISPSSELRLQMMTISNHTLNLTLNTEMDPYYGRVALLKARDDTRLKGLELNGWSLELIPHLEVDFIDEAHYKLLDAEPAKRVAKWIAVKLRAVDNSTMLAENP